jgi:hypothetical protein
MTPTEFAELTQNVIRDKGFEDFVPIACFPSRRLLRGLAGMPVEDQTEEAVLKWATGIAEPDEEYLVAFKCSAVEFWVIRVHGAEKERGVFLVD